ncbi:MAG: cytochrome b/b6 domain-containing protein [Alphaproteobacteria bacterium]
MGGWSLLVLIALHIGGALFHHAIRRDGTLMRMI